MIFLVMILVILVFVVLWNFDLHKILYVKYLTQNGGDAAALAASQWQAVTLDLIGELNIMQGVALTQYHDGTAGPEPMAIISDLQARLCYAGPMIGLAASQQAAKFNRIHCNDEFTDYLADHADTIRNTYPEALEEAYSGCFTDYADMLEAIADDGIAAGPESMQLYNDYLGDHMLLSKDFYDAISSRSWCWFYFNAMDLLNTYSNYMDWPPMPRIHNPRPINCEFFGLHLSKIRQGVLASRQSVANMNTLRQELELSNINVDYDTALTQPTTWYCYGGRWADTFAMSEPGFPAAGEVLPQYNYAGADAAIRIEGEADRKTPGAATRKIVWTAAAKPFGALNDTDTPSQHMLVLPCFGAIRLIPMDASSGASGGGFDLAWRKHAENHLPPYLQIGVDGLDSYCTYCIHLKTWERLTFRQSGIDWLAEYSHLCVRTGGGGGGSSSGGTRRGH